MGGRGELGEGGGCGREGGVGGGRGLWEGVGGGRGEKQYSTHFWLWCDPGLCNLVSLCPSCKLSSGVLAASSITHPPLIGGGSPGVC